MQDALSHDALALQQQANTLTAQHPRGTPCKYRPDPPDGELYEGRILAPFSVCGGVVVAWVDSWPACVRAEWVVCETPISIPHIDEERARRILDTLFRQDATEGLR